MSVQIQLRRGTEAEWAGANPVLALAEPGVAIDTRVYKLGDGSTAWADLPSVSEADAEAMIDALRTELVNEVIPAEVQGAMGDHGIVVDTSVGTRVFVGGVMVYGDTGWRDASGLLADGLAPSSNLGSCLIRRRGDSVTAALKVDVTADNVTHILSGVPVGFRGGREYVYDNSVFTANRVGAGASVLSPTHVGVIYPSSTPRPLQTGSSTPYPNPGTVAWTVTYTTDNAWPDTLPGAPA